MYNSSFKLGNNAEEEQAKQSVLNLVFKVGLIF